MLTRVMAKFSDIKTEPIPALLQDVIERLFAEQVVSNKPDVSIIDIFNEVSHDSNIQCFDELLLRLGRSNFFPCIL